MFSIAAGAHGTLWGELPREPSEELLVDVVKEERRQPEPNEAVRGEEITVAVVGLNSTSIPLIKSLLESKKGVKIRVVCYLCNESSGSYAGHLKDGEDGTSVFTISEQWTKQTIRKLHGEVSIEAVTGTELEPKPKQSLVRNRPNSKRDEEILKFFGTKNQKLALAIAGESTSFKATQDNQEANRQLKIKKLRLLESKLEEAREKEKRRQEDAEHLFGRADLAKWPKANSVDPTLAALREAMNLSVAKTKAANKVKNSKSIKWEKEASDSIPGSYAERSLGLEFMVKDQFLEGKTHPNFITCRTIKGFELALQKFQPKLLFIATEGNWAFSTFGSQFFSMFESIFPELKQQPLVFVLPSFPLTHLSKNKYSTCLSSGKVSFFIPRYEIYKKREHDRSIGYVADFSCDKSFGAKAKETAELNEERRTFEYNESMYTIRYFEEISTPIVIEEGMNIRRPLSSVFKDLELSDVKIRRVGFTFDSSALLPFFRSNNYMDWRKSVFTLMTIPELYHILTPLKLYIVYLSIIKSEAYYYQELRSNRSRELIPPEKIREAMREIIFSSSHFNKTVKDCLPKLRSFLKSDETLVKIVKVLEEFYGVDNLLSDGRGCSFFEGIYLLAKLRSELKRHVSNVEEDFGRAKKKKKMENCRAIVEGTKTVFKDFIHRGMVYKNGAILVGGGNIEDKMRARNVRHGTPVA